MPITICIHVVLRKFNVTLNFANIIYDINVTLKIADSINAPYLLVVCISALYCVFYA